MTRIQHPRRRRNALALRLIAGALSVAACVAGFAAIGAASSKSTAVSLNLNGGYKNRNIVACGDLHHYTFFHRSGGNIHFNGRVSPAPSGSYRVKLKLKKCKNGAFRTVWQKYYQGHPLGRVKGAFAPPKRGYYFARLYYYGTTPTAESDKQQFKITR